MPRNCVRRLRGGSTLAFCAALLALGCGAVDRGVPTDAVVSDTEYENSYFGLTFPFPADWSVAAAETEEHLREVGRNAIAGEDKALKATIDAASAKTYQLLTISEHPVGAAVAFNPTIVLMAEGVAHAPGIETGADYLFHMDKILAMSGFPAEAVGEVSPLDVGGRSFHRQDYDVSVGTGVRQAYLFTREGDYALGLVLTGRDAAEVETLLAMASKLRFH